MGHREALDADVLILEEASGLDEAPAGFGLHESGGERFLGQRRAEEGEMMLATKDFEARSVVPVFVREENTVEAFQLESDAFETEDNLLGAQSCIDKKARPLRAHHRAVSGASTAEDGKGEHSLFCNAILERGNAANHKTHPPPHERPWLGGI